MDLVGTPCFTPRGRPRQASGPAHGKGRHGSLIDHLHPDPGVKLHLPLLGVEAQRIEQHLLLDPAAIGKGLSQPCNHVGIIGVPQVRILIHGKHFLHLCHAP